LVYLIIKNWKNIKHIRWCINISILKIKIIYHQSKKKKFSDILSIIKSNNQHDIENKSNIEISKNKEF